MARSVLWRAWLAYVALCLLKVGACIAIDGDGPYPLSTEPAPGQRCSERLPLNGVTLTEEESALLPYLCLDPEDVERLEAGEAVDVVPSLLEEELPTGQGIPPGVECETRKWCDGTACTEVCERGSVRIPAWQSQAIRLQSRLSAALPLCYSTLLGTHNSGITLADGYGNRDEVFQSYFKYVKWAVPGLSDAPLRTSDQWLSLTDQLRLGVRVVELDTHWVGGALRIAHCGGLHLPKLNMLLKGLNLALKLLGKSVKWDTETLGCSPSLSSIAVDDQRLFSDALLEIRAWMDAEENEEEVLVLYFDDQPDLETWGCVPTLLSQLADAFPHEWFYTPQDAVEGSSVVSNDDAAPSAPPPPFPPPASPEPAPAPAWPSLAEMWAKGKRLLLVSGTDYGEAMAPLVFPRGGHGVCGWWEPPLKVTHVAPACSVGDQGDNRGAEATARLHDEGARPDLSDAQEALAALPAASSNAPRALFNGTWARVFSCELYYGPFDCEFVWGGSNAVLDVDTIPPVGRNSSKRCFAARCARTCLHDALLPSAQIPTRLS